MSETVTKEPLLRRLTFKRGSIRRKDSKSSPKNGYLNAPERIPISNLSPPELATSIKGAMTSSKQTMVDVGGQEIPLSTISIGVALLVIFSIIWKAMMAFSASLIRLSISVIVIGGVLLLSSGSEKQSKEALTASSQDSQDSLG